MSDKTSASATEDSQHQRYAVIGVRWSEELPELVIAFRDQESLRDLIATTRIIGIGLASRQAAVAVIPDSSLRDAASKETPEEAEVEREPYGGIPQSLRRRRGTFELKDIRHIVCSALQDVVALGVLTLYSKSAMGAALRVLIGA